MSVDSDSLVFWFFVTAWLVVLLLILFVPLPRIVREIQRMVKHVVALVSESPLPAKVAKAERDIARIEVALDSIPALERRARAAVLLIRTTPLIPPSLTAAAARIRREIRAFRRAAP